MEEVDGMVTWEGNHVKVSAVRSAAVSVTQTL